MLKAYRRHREPRCNKTDREHRRCACVIWVDGTLAGKRYHKTLRTRNWDIAQKKVLALEANGAPDASKTITEATDGFIRDCEARGLREPSIYKYRLLFKQLKAFAENRGMVYITECDVETMRLFRESWVNKNYSARKKLEALRTFFKFVRDSGWLASNPAAAIKSPKVVEGTTLPYTKPEVERVLAACNEYPHEDHPNKYWGERLLALPRGSLQKRPMGDGSKPANGCSRDLVLLAQFLFLRQARFCAPAPWAAFQDVTVV